MNDNLIAPIQERFLHGQTKEAIKEEALAMGYSLEEFESAYNKVIRQYGEHTLVSKDTEGTVKNDSILTKRSISICAALLFFSSIAFAVYAYNAGLDPVLSTTVETQPNSIETPANSEANATTMPETTATETQQQTEIDAYGVDLFALKTGTTTTYEKVIDGDTVSLTYISYGDTVEREAVTTYADGGVQTETDRISLNMRNEILGMIAELEDKQSTDCFIDTPKPECETVARLLDILKTVCLEEETNESMGTCAGNAYLEATLFVTQPSSPQTSTTSDDTPDTEIPVREWEYCNEYSKEYASKLAVCEPFSCRAKNSFDEESIDTIEILGIENGLCATRHESVAHVTECAYPEAVRIEVAEYLTAFVDAKRIATVMTNDETGHMVAIKVFDGVEYGEDAYVKAEQEGICTTIYK